MKKILTILAAFLLFGVTMKAQEKIFYVAPSVSAYNTIFSINTDGTGKVQLFNDTYHRTAVDISVDNELYYLRRSNAQGTYGDVISICKSDINGQNETVLWTYPNSANFDLRNFLALRTDKQKILYATVFHSNRDGDVFELDLTTLISTNISNNNDYMKPGAISYSKDLSKILFIECGTPWFAHPWYMYLINSDGTNRTQITPNGVGSYYNPKFSHDGSKMVYMFNVNLGEPEQLYIANSDGTNGQRIMLSSGASDNIWNPTFSPDDTKLVFFRSPNMVISNTNGTIITEFPTEALGDQQNIVWTTLKSITTISQSTSVGKIFDVLVNTSDLKLSDNVIAYQFDYNYDNTKLEYVGNSLLGTLAAGGTILVNSTTGKLSIGWARGTALVGTGALVKLQFKSLVAGTTTPTITSALFNSTPVTLVTNGTITSTIKYGDIDVNGFVQAYDAALAIQYSVGLDPLPIADPLPWETWRIKVADVDGVVGVTANDASLILKYTVG
jgi:hypothetical protein